MGMAWKHLPEQWQQSLAREDRLPRRLDPARWRLRQATAEFLAKHPLPGIELEREFDRAIVVIDKPAILAPSDLRDVAHGRAAAGLARDIFEILQRAEIFGVVEDTAKMNMPPSGNGSPRVD